MFIRNGFIKLPFYYLCNSIEVQYNRLLQVLYGKNFAVDPRTLDHMVNSESEAVYFYVRDGVYVSTAHASLCLTPPMSQVFLNNVITLPEFEGQGFGKKLLAFVEEDAKCSWGQFNHGCIRLILTNSPRKGNAGFYERCGFTPRTEEAGRPTVVWVKDL